MYELYERGTYQRGPRLVRLCEGTEPATLADVAELFRIYCEGAESAGVPPELSDFAMWVSGTGDYADVLPCEVVW